MTDVVNLLIASDLSRGWRIAWIVLIDGSAIASFIGAVKIAQWVLDEVKPWIAKVLTRAHLRRQRQNVAMRVAERG
jgi:hypothetical protein